MLSAASGWRVVGAEYPFAVGEVRSELDRFGRPSCVPVSSREVFL